MKTKQKIITSVLLIASLFSTTILEASAANSVKTQEEMIAISQKVTKRNDELMALINNFYANMEAYMTSIKGNTEAQKALLVTLKTTNSKISKLLETLKLVKYQNNIYRGIYNKDFSAMQVKINGYISTLTSATTPVVTTGTTTVTTVKVGATDAEKATITQQTVNYASSSSYTKDNTADQGKVQESLVLNGGYTQKEAELLAMKNLQGDGFEFCANFTPDVYTNVAYREYQDAQSSVASEYKAFKNKFIPNRWKTGYDTLSSNNSRIQKCVAQMGGVTQQEVKALYEKVYGKTFTVWTTPYYMDGTSTDDFESHVINIDQYIKNHHNW